MQALRLTQTVASRPTIKSILHKCNLDHKVDLIDGTRLGFAKTYKSPRVFSQIVLNGVPISPHFKNSIDPSTNTVISNVVSGETRDVQLWIDHTEKYLPHFRSMSAVKRGEILADIKRNLEEEKEDLANLITLEMGKIKSEALGEVQEFIDVCEYAVGLSRRMRGSIFPSERQDHALMEVYNPIGRVGVISAFNFPMAVYGWNAALALVCGNAVLWKGSPTTNLCSLAVIDIMQKVLEEHGLSPSLCGHIAGGAAVGKAMAENKGIDLLSFTGSTKVGKEVGTIVQSRFGRSILELGGNNAIVVMDDADVNLAVKSILFAAIGTAGQRCTTVRRLYVHERIYDSLMNSLQKAYQKVVIGDPFDQETLCGPLHTQASIDVYKGYLKTLKQKGGRILYGGNVDDSLKGFFVQPTLVEMEGNSPLIHEHFVPILPVQKITSLSQAIELNNNVPQGLSSSLFTSSVKNAFEWMSANGSDCGIVNVNISTSGAEIGGAFGGEKASGSGRESGSDSWKQYMRQQTCTVNWGGGFQLSQGVSFDGI